MHIRKAIETSEGTVIFEGELKGDELAVVITVGLNALLQAGALPFLTEEKFKTTALGPLTKQ